MLTSYLKIKIGDQFIVVSDPTALPISIDYTLEDPDNFQDKKSATALGIKIPATTGNDQAANSFSSPDIMDLTTGEVFRNMQDCVIEESGFELIKGKAFLKSALHNSRPIAYNFDIYGDNADWLLEIQDTTFYDVLSHLHFIFNKDTIVASWAFDGTDENLPYVFGPVRYRFPMGGYTIDSLNNSVAIDDNMLPVYMKPAISKYWILFWAFKTAGYRLQSDFMDMPYFRRQVMPWTWGNFLNSDGNEFDQHLFRAASVPPPGSTDPNAQYHKNGTTGPLEDDNRYVFWDLGVSNSTTLGMFDNNHDYSYDPVAAEMKWTYNPPFFGNLEATFSVIVNVNAAVQSNSDVGLRILWYKNGVLIQTDQLVNESAPYVSVAWSRDIGQKSKFFTTAIAPGDVISAKIKVRIFQSTYGSGNIDASIAQFQIDYFTIPIGGTIDFKNYDGLKNFKPLDMLRGIIDEFNLSINTDPVNKVVVIEPTHPFSITNNLSQQNPGYFKNDFIDWNGKEDLIKDWEMDNYSDYTQQLSFNYKDDGNDGVLKLVQDRNINIVAKGRYILPSRFGNNKSVEENQKKVENRFFSPTMHYNVDQWKALGTGINANISPQMVCLVPDNISNTSASSSDNTFQPKSVYYKGLVTGAGAWKFDGTVMQQYPFMFSVNYNPGGENDPILSYSDEAITRSADGSLTTESGFDLTTESGETIVVENSNAKFNIGFGLVKRFYWQRMAIMRNGQWYNGWFRLKNIDVANQLHREYKSYKGQRWELIQIKGYTPLAEQSTACLMRKWSPIEQTDQDNTYPSADAILNGITPSITSLDLKYARLICLLTDIPS